MTSVTPSSTTSRPLAELNGRTMTRRPTPSPCVTGTTRATDLMMVMMVMMGQMQHELMIDTPAADAQNGRQQPGFYSF